MGFYQTYKGKFHFSVNFYSIFLLVTFIPDLLGLPPSLFTYGFWALKASLAFWIIYQYRKTPYNLNGYEQLFLFTAFVYFINIAIDVFFQDFPMGVGNPIDLLGFFLSILIAFSFRYDNAFGSDRSFYFFLISLSLGLVIAFFMAKASPPPLVGRFDANSTVNTINYGQMGCALSVVSLYGFFNKKIRYGYVLYALLFLLGIISIMKAGSRSPVVVLLGVSLFYFLSRSGITKGLIVSIAALFALWLSLDFLIALSEAVGSSIVIRLLSALETGETSGRDKIYANAIEIFQNAPLFGDYYLIPSGIGKGGYPHNFFIEVFMTTGLIGGIPFVILVVLTLLRSFRLLKGGHPAGWIILLFIQMLIYGMFSSSLYSSQDFWALGFFILSMSPVIVKYPKLALIRKKMKIDRSNAGQYHNFHRAGSQSKNND